MQQNEMKRIMRGILTHLEKISLAAPPDQWDWSVGVGVLGVVRAHKVTGDPAYLDFLKAWIRRNAPERKMYSVNHVIPAFGALYLWEFERDPAMLSLADDCARWCMEEAKRTTNGGLAHVWIGGDEDFKNQLWVDSIYMSVLFLLFYGIHTAKPAMVCEAVKQLSLHAAALCDPQSGLYYHGYHCLSRKPLGCFWGRGNGWMAAALADCAALLSGTPYYADDAISWLKQLCQSAFRLKSANGMLHTVLNRPDSYEEMTATMLFGYAAVEGWRCGWLDDSFLEWSEQILARVAENVKEEGNIDRCSAGTDPSTEEVYRSRPFTDSPFGDGIALSFLSAMYDRAEK